MGRRNSIGAIGWIFFFLCLSPGCTQVGLRVERPVRSVVVIPFFKETISGEEKRFVEGPMSGRLFVAGETPPNARRELTDLIYQKLAVFPQLQVMPRHEVERATEREDFERDPMASALKIGEAFDVDGVVLGWVFRYEERIGSAISVEHPASVSFVIHLVGVKERCILWSGRFQETQQPLSENILRFASFLRRKGTWRMAKGLASAGMDEVLVSFPASRERPESEGG